MKSIELSTLSHLPTVLLHAAKFCVSRVTARGLKTPHFLRVYLKFPNQLLKPRVADAKLLSPAAIGRLLPPTGVPQERILRQGKLEAPDTYQTFREESNKDNFRVVDHWLGDRPTTRTGVQRL